MRVRSLDRFSSERWNAKVWANLAIKEDFKWAHSKIEDSTGILLLKSMAWEINDASLIINTDACPTGMGFWYPVAKRGFTSPTPPNTPSSLNNFYEALTVLCVLHHAHQILPRGSRIVIYTDSFTAVTIFNSFRSSPDYSCILKAAVDILLAGDHSLRVLHVPGDLNNEADALSRGDLMRVLQLQPGLTIRQFHPYERQERRQSLPLLRPP